MKQRRSICVGPCLLALGFVFSCASAPYTPKDLVLPQTSAEIWDALVQTATQMGYRENPRNTSRADRKFESVWRVHNAAFGQGSRDRLSAELVPQAGETSGWVVRYFIERQRVANMARSMNPQDSDWEASGQLGDKELVFAARLRGNLGLPVLGVQKGSPSSR